MSIVEIVDTRTGLNLHLKRYPGVAYCSVTFDKNDRDLWIANPYNKRFWKDVGKPLCSRCEYNFRLERQRVDDMLAAYGYVR